jgi:L-ascorbate metabolism protein UlaG (beta-lactamase superfamily)
MKITKLVHSCLLVEMPEPVNRTALFDPGVMSDVDVESLEYLDDIFITHGHQDHLDVQLLKKLITKFPQVRVTAPSEVVAQLSEQGITASDQAPEGVRFFDSPHEDVMPMFPAPQEFGVHYLEKLSHPGDSHNFTETMEILALPVQGPWGSSVNAMNLALQLKPKYVIPIHDWHWRDEARDQMYERFEQVLGKAGITFIKPVNGEPFVLDM